MTTQQQRESIPAKYYIAPTYVEHIASRGEASTKVSWLKKMPGIARDAQDGDKPDTAVVSVGVCIVVVGGVT